MSEGLSGPPEGFAGQISQDRIALRMDGGGKRVRDLVGQELPLVHLVRDAVGSAVLGLLTFWVLMCFGKALALIGAVTVMVLGMAVQLVPRLGADAPRSELVVLSLHQITIAGDEIPLSSIREVWRRRGRFVVDHAGGQRTVDARRSRGVDLLWFESQVVARLAQVDRSDAEDVPVELRDLRGG